MPLLFSVQVDKNTAAFARAQGHEDAATAADDETNLDESTAVVAPREERCADQGEQGVDRLSSQAAVSEDAMKIDESTAVTMRGEESCADHGEQRGDHPTPHAERSEGAREQQSEAAPITEAATPHLMASNEAPVAMEVQQEGRGLKRRRSFDGGQKALALRYKACGYPVFSASISWDAAKNKKVLRMPDRWQRCDLRNCLASFFDPMEPAILINTTTCDLVALDADVWT
ncbi:hypothetical protein KFL_005960020 [Klebsormidium nitens]|uniref:Uncharacterized protein n=1 Tax=Klebsormidium nitens TaxID=105231 RepID=A0A1Y1ILQ1_KLENI|nr:hypothetical protein KFL_005960020 [Klebsormidium nitens]|eukprot:GAQ90071.1 hypothetical protein KFL_005960020 [Klebsormidium nitens]